MVVTNDETLYDRAIHFKGQGLAKHREYWHDVVGYNYRMTNICAAIGLAQLEQANVFIEKKREIAKRYSDACKGFPVKFHREVGNVVHTYWMCLILVNDTVHRDPLREALAAGGVETRPSFSPAHTMPMYATKYQRHPVAENLGWGGINLPSCPGLEKKEIGYVCQVINDYFARMG